MALYFIGADKEVLQGEIVSAGAVPGAVKLCSSGNSEVQAEAADLLKVGPPSLLLMPTGSRPTACLSVSDTARHHQQHAKLCLCFSPMHALLGVPLISAMW